MIKMFLETPIKYEGIGKGRRAQDSTLKLGIERTTQLEDGKRIAHKKFKESQNGTLEHSLLCGI